MLLRDWVFQTVAVAVFDAFAALMFLCLKLVLAGSALALALRLPCHLRWLLESEDGH